MGLVGKILKWTVILAILALVALGGWLFFAPPDLIRGAGTYAAKVACSSQFVAGRDGKAALPTDVYHGHPILEYFTVDIDPEAKTVRGNMLGLFGGGLAIYREGAGCVAVPDGDIAAAAMPPLAAPAIANADAIWPEGARVEPTQDPAIASILADNAMTGPGMRAVVVAHNGRIVAERYAEGFTADTPLLGWSMTKTVTAAIVGTLIGDGRLALDQDGLFEAWNGDERGAITIADLMAMSSGLEFLEDYGTVTDVTRMLYLEPDMPGFAASKPLLAPPGQLFSYSSGTTVLLSRIWQDAFDSPEEALSWPREVLFDPLGMSSAVLEADARGTFAGSSYLYATARDWARFGELLRNDGVWAGKQILPDGFAQWMREPAPASGGTYGRGQLWLRGPSAGTPQGQNPDAGFDLPADTFWLSGHDGQSTAVIPSRGLVVVRLGVTPSRLGYKPQRMLEALTRALPQ